MNAHKRHFVQVWRRWDAMFKRADKGDVTMEKILMAEYFRSLGHLSPMGLEALTEMLKQRVTFFPTIKECMDIINVKPLSGDWGNPFIGVHPELYDYAAAPVLPWQHPRAQISANAPMIQDHSDE